MSAAPYAYDRRGLLAVDPRAFSEVFMCSDQAPPNSEVPGATIISITGPLDARPGWFRDSYESINARVADACTKPGASVVLRISSPGGDASGCFEGARKARALCDAAGKALYAFVDDRAASAAYAYAAVADKIFLSDTAVVGSIGILCTRTDVSAAAAAQGVKVAFIASGARKADGHPEAPMSDAELIAQQRVVDSVAEVFFALVSEFRGIDAKALDAGVFHGQDAINRGLADEVTTFDALLATIQQGPITMDPMESARAALTEAANAGNAAAKRALAAMDAPAEDKPADDDKDKKDAKAEDKTDDKSAESDTPPPSDKDKDPAARAEAIALAAQAELHKFKAQIANEKIAAERATLLAGRPDLSPELRASLGRAPIETVRDMIKSLPRIDTGAGASAALAAAGAAPTLGDDRAGADGQPAYRQSPAEAAALRAQMGVGVTYGSAVESTDYKLTLGKPVTKLTVPGVTNG